jgi:hypothetical protein
MKATVDTKNRIRNNRGKRKFLESVYEGTKDGEIRVRAINDLRKF